NLAMGQQCRLVAQRLRHVATDQAQMWFARLAGLVRSSDQVVHPGATAFGLARMPVRIERAQMATVLGVVYIVKTNVGMPGLRLSLSLSLADAQPEESLGKAEHAFNDLADREVWPQFLIIEIIA